MSTFIKQMSRDSFTYLLFGLISSVLGYGFRLVNARYLSPEEYGLFYAVFSFIALFTVLKVMGLNQSLVKFIPELFVSKKLQKLSRYISYGFLLQFGAGAVVFLLLLFTNNLLSTYYFKTSQSVLLVVFLGLAFWFQSIESTIMIIFRGLKKHVLRASIDASRSAYLIGCSFIGFTFGLGILSPAIAYATVPLFLLVVYSIPLKKLFSGWFTIKKKLQKTEVKHIMAFSFPLILTALSGQIIQYSDTFMLTFFTTLEDVGLYNVAYPTAQIITYFAVAIATPLLPLISELNTKKNKRLIASGLQFIYKYLFILAVFPVLVLVNYSSEILLLIFGAEYVAAANLLEIFAIGLVFICFVSVNNSVLTAIGKPWYVAKILGYAAVLNIVFNLIFIPFFGSLGAAISAILSYLLMFTLSFRFIFREIKLRTSWKALGMILGTAGITYLILDYGEQLVSSYFEYLVLIGISGFIYVGTLILLKVITIQELKGYLKGARN